MKSTLAILCALLTGCSTTLTRRGPLDPSLTAFISPDAVVLAGVRMDQIRATPLYRKLTAQKTLPSLDNFSPDDVHDLLLVTDGKDALAVARGEFKGKRPTELQALPYKDYTIFVRDEHSALAFLDDHTALGGPPAAIRAAIEQWSRHAGSAPRGLIARAQALPADAQIWAVAAGWKGVDAGTLREMGNAANFDRLLRSVEGANLTVDLHGGVHANATGDCRTEADAKTLSDSLRGLAGIARIGVPKDRPELARVFDGIQIGQQGTVVKLTIDIPEDVALKLW